MTAQELLNSATSGSSMPDGLSSTQKALWLEKSGDWHASHDLCNEIPDPSGAWIHAYLHRVEGDLGNASYWYHRAGKDMPTCSLDEEWIILAQHFAS
ncbi:hypothetical protein Rhal01_00812 [Rubritalea halochordaticola]|uniref:Uncharacterized protein n=1 Tax=Rubritalea halochordaticola TaxID=714537 RepID=A0ABP9UY95_9BACT